MPPVLFTFKMACGCTEGMVDEGFALVVCSVDVCRGHWWCECADPDDPVLCEHAESLLAALNEL